MRFLSTFTCSCLVQFVFETTFKLTSHDTSKSHRHQVFFFLLRMPGRYSAILLKLRLMRDYEKSAVVSLFGNYMDDHLRIVCIVRSQLDLNKAKSMLSVSYHIVNIWNQQKKLMNLEIETIFSSILLHKQICETIIVTLVLRCIDVL